jgi:ribonuclease J
MLPRPGRLYKDGRIVGGIDTIGVIGRRRLSFGGHIAVSIVLDERGDVILDPDIVATGIPDNDASGRPMIETARNAILSALESIPRRAPPRRGGRSATQSAGRRVAPSMRRGGKKPVCTVFVAVV